MEAEAPKGRDVDVAVGVEGCDPSTAALVALPMGLCDAPGDATEESEVDREAEALASSESWAEAVTEGERGYVAEAVCVTVGEMI